MHRIPMSPPLALRLSLPLIGVLLMTACAPISGSATTTAVCDELRRKLPTWSTHDTEQSKTEGADFLDTFAAVCP